MAGLEDFSEGQDKHQERAWADPTVRQAYIIVLGSRSLADEELAGEDLFDHLKQQNHAIAKDPRVIEATDDLDRNVDEAVIALAKLSRSLDAFSEAEQAARREWVARTVRNRELTQLEIEVSGIPDTIGELE